MSSSTMKGRIVVFSITGCPHCMRAKNTLSELGLAYTNVGLDSFPQCRDDVKTRTGKNTVPQIFFNAHYIGGNEDLQTLVQDKTRLDSLTEDITTNEPPADAPQIPDPSTAVAGVTFDFTCEPDEYAKLVADFRATGLIKDNRKGLRVHKNSFTGKQFVDWVVETKQIDRDTAVEMGQQLLDQNFGHQLEKISVFRDADEYYRLLEDDESCALNAGDVSKCTPKKAGELADTIRKLILKIYGAFLSADGKSVNYNGIKTSSEFAQYKKLTAELLRVNVVDVSREEKLAFFINIYNALVIHANIERGPPTNLWQRYKFFNTVQYIIGGYSYSLQDIENGVLRGNKKGVGMFSVSFGKGDPRLKVVLEGGEPLIHFALVCGAKSCPPIKTYSADDIDSELQLAAESFLEGEEACSVNPASRQIKLSMIFKWYRQDFGKDNQQVAQFVHDHMGVGSKKSELAELLAGNSTVKLSYAKYDWAVNSND